MSDKGIIFSAAMVRALVREAQNPGSGKTQTRRLAKFIEQQPNGFWHCRGRHGGTANCSELSVPDFGPDYAPYAAGDRLYVREACRAEAEEMGFSGVRFLADNVWRQIQNTPEAAEAWGKLYYYGKKPADHVKGIGKGVPSIHMPRWASRITLTVTDVRVQRLQDISEADAIAEGILSVQSLASGRIEHFGVAVDDAVWPTARRAYQALWESLHADPAESWDANPWVVAYSWPEVLLRNIDSEAA